MLMSCLERLADLAFVGWGEYVLSLSLSAFRLPCVDQNVRLSAIGPAECLFASLYKDHGLTF